MVAFNESAPNARLSPMAELRGISAAMRSVYDRVAVVSRSEARVLITGESGTGKELVARALHSAGPRGGRSFVAINCAAFPDGLIESELFGHGKGAFTGAVSARPGCFKRAHHGTLFLDEVGELSLAAQAKLLRVLQEGTIEPLGTDTTVPVDVRVLAATHRDLKQCIVDGTFREDLYYRLNVLHIALPPLRGRLEDLPLLVSHLIDRHTTGAPPGITPRALEALAAYPFPGNVRELENAIQHALVMSEGRDIDVEDLPTELVRQCLDRPTLDVVLPQHTMTLGDAKNAFERSYVVHALRLNQGRRIDTARMLGISRKCLWEKLRDHGIEPGEYQA